MPQYRDPVDGSVYDLAQPRWRSDACRPLWIDAGRGIDHRDIDPAQRSIWRYRAALPIAIDQPISLGEGLTPLVQTSWAGDVHPYFKLDFLNPTGSFKDRGTSVMLSYLREHGITTVVEDSSGNGGASIAGYGAAGGLHVKILAPESTAAEKIAQVQAYGAELQLVSGPREASQTEAIRQTRGEAFYASHNWQAFFLQGTKTLAYELWEDLGFEAPDNVIVPVGAGSSLLGCWLGFQELHKAGQITQLPRLFAAQPLHCSPLDAAFSTETTGPSVRPVLPTVAEGTAIAQPLRLSQMLTALKDSKGYTVAVTEQEIIQALGQLASRGFFVEPTSAVAGAGLSKLLLTGRISPLETTVVLLSGSGLKATSKVAELIARPNETP